MRENKREKNVKRGKKKRGRMECITITVCFSKAVFVSVFFLSNNLKNTEGMDGAVTPLFPLFVLFHLYSFSIDCSGSD